MQRPIDGARRRRWLRRPEGSNWGDFGDDDQIGRLNLLTPDKVLQGVREVREGLSFCLSLPLDCPGGNVANARRHPPRLFAAHEGGKAIYNHVLRHPDGQSAGVVCDDAVLLYNQYSTQWDSLAHFGAEFDADDDGVAEIVYYNGWTAKDAVIGPPPNPGAEPWARFEGPRAAALGVDTMAATCVQGRAVLVDLHAHFGRAHRAVGFAELQSVLEADAVEIEAGDILCLYTGFDRVLLEAAGRPSREGVHGACCGLDGADPALLDWVTRSNIAAIVSDNRAVELLPLSNPSRSAYAAPLHAHCLFKLGLPLGEMWLLGELAAWLRAHHRNRFLLTAPPLRLPGAVGSPVTPVGAV